MESLYNKALSSAAEADQGKLLRFWKELSPSEQVSLAEQIVELDLNSINEVFKEAQRNKLFQGRLEEFPKDKISSFCSDDDGESWKKIGMEAIARNEVCVLLLSGGQGTRLGSEKPKALFDIGLPSKKPLLQIQAEKIQKLETLAGGEIPWYIMTSEATDDDIRGALEASGSFGLNPEQIHIFSQGTFPCLSDDGDILLEDHSTIARSPDGNGGLFRALKEEDVMADMERRQIKHVFVYCVDNVLVKVADPEFLGFCISREAECGNKVVARRQGESVGINGLIDGKPGVVEYSEISEELRDAVDGDGNLVHNLANICVHYFSIDFLSRAVSLEESLPAHTARKKIPHVTEAGNIVKPDTPNGFKLEKFVFDVFQFADPERFVVFKVRREEEFEPLKQAEGEAGSPESCRTKISRLHAKWLLAAGAELVAPGGGSLIGEDGEDDTKIDKNMIVEVSPRVSYAGEGLEKLVQGKTLAWPLHLTENKTYL